MLNVLLQLRPADALNFFFLAILTVITVAYRHVVDHTAHLILLYSGLFFAQAFLILFREKNRAFHWVYHLIFPTISILVIFDSLGHLVHAINPQDIDPLLISLDRLLFGGHPTVMMEHIMTPLLTDLLQLAYSSYYFLPVTLGAVLLIRRREDAFDRSLFLIMFCFYLSYAGYLLFPALGPRFTMNHLQHEELRGLFLTGPVQELLNRLEGIKRDAFPSGHTGIALTVLVLSRQYEKKLFRLFLPFVTALIFSTVYLRYHYVVDVLAGVILAALTLFLGDAYYGYWQKRFRSGH
ncbi:MAG: phosphatase PAP2 family protein [Nitrospirae bacterium]|nr:phosphatase PAP2 family protein [Nitrospirota bacterium]